MYLIGWVPEVAYLVILITLFLYLLPVPIKTKFGVVFRHAIRNISKENGKQKT